MALWFMVHGPQQQVKPQVEGVQSEKVDPNHPVEIYFGDANYRDLYLMEYHLGTLIYPQDKVEAFPNPTLGLGSKITITRATPVQVTDAKVTTTYRTWQTTVGGLMKENNLVLLGEDSVNPIMLTPISYNLSVKITRVAHVELKETQVIAFQTITKNDPAHYRGDPDIVQQTGQNGQKVLTYQITREDGVEVSRKLTGTQTTPAQNKIILHGTKLKIKETISGRATWYNSRYNAASHLWPKGTHIRVTNPANGKSIETVVDDYMESDQSVVDLKLSLFQQLADPYGTMPSLTVDWVLN